MMTSTKKHMRAHKWILFTLSLSLLLSLQGCFVVSLTHGWSGQSKLQFEDRKNSPYLTTSIRRKPHMVILPLVFLEWANKKYGVEFAFGSFTTSLDMIDSVQYSIYNEKEGTIYELGQALKTLFTFASDTN